MRRNNGEERGEKKKEKKRKVGAQKRLSAVNTFGVIRKNLSYIETAPAFTDFETTMRADSMRWAAEREGETGRAGRPSAL